MSRDTISGAQVLSNPKPRDGCPCMPLLDGRRTNTKRRVPIMNLVILPSPPSYRTNDRSMPDVANEGRQWKSTEIGCCARRKEGNPFLVSMPGSVRVYKNAERGKDFCRKGEVVAEGGTQGGGGDCKALDESLDNAG